MRSSKNFMMKLNRIASSAIRRGGGKLRLVTHDGSFHADDIFAAATLAIMLEKKSEQFEIIRTRDKEIVEKGYYVFDGGGIYDENKNKFDHHQVGGAGERNSIPYAAFGLVWKKYGAEVSGSLEVARLIERKLVMPVDADDNAVNLFTNNFPDILPYKLHDVLATFAPSSLEDMSKDEQFLKAYTWAKEILEREIKKTKDQIKLTEIIRGFYKASQDKRLIVIDKPKVSRFEIWDALADYPEPLFIVYGDNLDWPVVSMRKDKTSFGNRKDFPKSWGGLDHDELAKITGVADAIFCHKGLFLSAAKSKEGAIQLAKRALAS